MPKAKPKSTTEKSGAPSHGTLAEIAGSINKDLKTEVLVPGDEDSLSTIHTWVPTGLTLLDLFLYGGLPIGRIWEIYGEPHHGKTALAQLLMVAVQRAGGISVYLDAEGTFDLKRALSMGHDPSKHFHLQADTVELGFQTIDKTIKAFREERHLTCPLLFVWDTIAASQTEKEKVNDRWGDGMAAKPRIIREALRRLSLELGRGQAGLVFCNQTVASFAKFGPSFDTPGGGAIKFWSTYRVHVSKAGWFQPSGEVDAGILSGLKLVKCKVGPPNRKIILPLTYDHGFDENHANIDFLLRTDATATARRFIEKSGAYYHLHVPEEVFGTDTIKTYYSGLAEKFLEYPGLAEYIAEAVKAEWTSAFVL